MKIKQFFFRGLLFFAMSVVLMLASCSSENEPELNLDDTNQQTTYIKDITIFDESKENSIVMRVSADDPSIVENYSKDNFKIIPVPIGKTTAEVLTNINVADEEETNGYIESDAQAIAVNAPEINFETISKNLNSGIKNVAITFLHPENNDYRASWSVYTHTSDQDIDHVAFITRHSVTRRVYIGLEYKPYSTSSWSSIIAAWKKLKNKDVVNEQRSICHQFKLRVKTKKSSAYTYSFEP
ncbi:hypothetical protein [Tenacibaculum agarivorans]|uniref:hypothetical protein n=1 Tax=Tenacibaculum agarivorans TaxID=1908389 RepID=UPI00094B8971|nr:hypothetical protein [Tenacibaculum agarivorans]